MTPPRPMAKVSPPIIVHLYGPQCAGKSRLLSKVPSEAVWDIAQFNRGVELGSNGYVRRDSMFVVNRLKKFVHAASDTGKRVVFVETSGGNKAVNSFLKRMSKVHHVVYLWVKGPDDDELRKRCELRGLDYARTRAFNRGISRFLHHNARGFPMDQDEAQNLIDDIMGGL